MGNPQNLFIQTNFYQIQTKNWPKPDFCHGFSLGVFVPLE